MRLCFALVTMFLAQNSLSYDYIVTDTKYLYPTNLLMSAADLGQGGASMSYGEGIRNINSNPASLAYSHMLESSINTGTLFNYRFVSSIALAYKGAAAGYCMSRPTLSELRSDASERVMRDRYGFSTNHYWLGYGYSFFEWLAAGTRIFLSQTTTRVSVNINASYEQPEYQNVDYKNNLYTADAGIMCNFHLVHLGMTLRNYGFPATASNVHEDHLDKSRIVPVSVLSGSVSVLPYEGVRLAFQMDASGRDQGIPRIFKGGAEFEFNPWLVGRFGYDSEFGNETGGGLCIGTGIHLGDFFLDMAFVDGVRLPNSQRYSLSALLGVSYFILSQKEIETEQNRLYGHRIFDKQSQDMIRVLKNKAIEYELVQDWQHALDNYDLLLTFNPDNKEYRTKYDEISLLLQTENVQQHFNSYQQYMNQKAYSDACLEAQAILKFDPENAEAQNMLVTAQQRMADVNNARKQEISTKLYDAEFAYSSGDFLGCINRLSEIELVDPNNEQANELLNKAKQHLDEAITENLTQAKTKLKDNRLDEALKHYNAVLAIKLNEANLAELGLMEKVAEAKTGKEQCYLLKQERTARLKEEAIRYFNLGQYDAAESRFRILVNVAGEEGFARNYIARIHSRIEPSSSNDASISKQNRKVDYANTYQLGVSAYTARDYSTAIAYWNQIPASDPLYSKAQTNINRTRAILSVLSGD